MKEKKVKMVKMVKSCKNLGPLPPKVGMERSSIAIAWKVS